MRRLAERSQRITELAAEEHIKQPGMNLLVNRMEGRGWATRAPDPSDGRAALVTLTPAGQKELQALEAGYHDMLAAHIAALALRARPPRRPPHPGETYDARHERHIT
jgi:DNA-binding MarR family transcriptional regulator